MDFAISVESSFAVSLLRRYNVWYSIADGNWSLPNTWMSNALYKNNFTSPQPGDTVYINHTVALDTTIAVNNIYISGKLTADNNTRILTVNGDLQATGVVDFTGSNVLLILNGVNNSMVSFTSGSASTVRYNALLSQNILPFTYQNLYLTGTSIAQKNLTANLTVNGNATIGSILNTNGFDISIAGTTTGVNPIGLPSATATINSVNNITFTGLVTFGGGDSINIVGAATVNIAAGVSVFSVSSSWASSTVNAITNNQTFTLPTSQSLTLGSLNVVGTITVNTVSSNVGPLIIVGALNGSVAGSTFNNDGILQFNSNATQMTTGVFNYMHTAGSTIIYNFNGAYTLPFTTYEKLTIQGTGIKTTSGALTVNSALTLNNGILNMGANNLTCSGTTMCNGATSALNKTGAGTMLFVGLFMTSTGSANSDWSGGNPNCEFRSGINMLNGSLNTGTGAISFTTNSQTIQNGQTQTWNASISIASGLTLTISSTAIVYTGTINGASSTSILDNRGVLNYQSSTAPMATGKLYCNQATNTWLYGLTGNQDIQPPSDPVSPGYSNLTLQGTGAKTLLGNVSVKGVYTLMSPATLNSNGFSLTNP